MNTFINDVLDYVQNYYNQIVALFPKAILSIILLAFFWLLSRVVRNRLKPFLTGRTDDPLLTQFILQIVKAVLLIIAILMVLKILGLGNIAVGVWGTAGVGAFIIGFAFKDIFEHFLAGIILAFDRPFRIGDIVELDGNKGVVAALTIRSTHIKTFDGQDVYIPNGNIIKNALKNYTIDGFIRQDFKLGLDYGSDVNQAIQIILNELNKIPGILKEEKRPSVVISELAPSSLNLMVFYWLDTFDKSIDAGMVKIKAVDKVLNALTKAGFYLPGDIIEIRKKPNDPLPGFAA